MAWITSGYMDKFIGATTRAALDASDSDTFDQYEEQARAIVQMFIEPQGYVDVGTTTTNVTLQLLCASHWYLLAASAKKGLEIPEAVKTGLALANAVFEGRMPIPGLDSNPADGVGGVKASSTSETSSAGRPRRWDRYSIRRL